jgi:hypothetical protein
MNESASSYCFSLLSVQASFRAFKSCNDYKILQLLLLAHVVGLNDYFDLRGMNCSSFTKTMGLQTNQNNKAIQL